jgi:membrane associated rhomboid family serine protease
MRFLHKSERFFEIPHATIYALVAVNIAAYFLCFKYSGEAAIPADLLLRNGAMHSLAIAKHEYWRLLAHGFLHADLLHLAANMIFLILWGALLEKRIGSHYFLLVYFCALIGGAIVSVARRAQTSRRYLKDAQVPLAERYFTPTPVLFLFLTSLSIAIFYPASPFA